MHSTQLSKKLKRKLTPKYCHTGPSGILGLDSNTVYLNTYTHGTFRNQITKEKTQDTESPKFPKYKGTLGIAGYIAGIKYLEEHYLIGLIS